MTSNTRIAVIGAGMAGLACASVLQARGAAVQIFEKSRGLGGRLATRRIDDWAFDHGAQYFTAMTAEFRSYVRNSAGTEAWRPRGADSGTDWYLGVPQQNNAVSALGEGMEVHRGRRVSAVHGAASQGWRLTLDNGEESGPFKAVAVAIPAPQARSLLQNRPAFAALDEVSMQPCWALLLAVAAPLAIPDVQRNPCESIAWIAANHSKPGRPGGPGQYVIHATPQWSRRHLEQPATWVRDQLLAALFRCLGQQHQPLHAVAHRWRYALVDKALGRPFLLDAQGTLGVAGDWCLGYRVESAFTSGRALGRELARQI
jgi:predicted NAD/FAD-dependent oxidoreductase